WSKQRRSAWQVRDNGLADSQGSSHTDPWPCPPGAGRGSMPFHAMQRILMSAIHPDDPQVRVLLYQSYREFFDLAEKKRRWSLADDVPWDRCNPGLAPEIADVVESFCAVEMYLPDYIAKALPLIRANRGLAWL